jgi:hypothetical protein
MKSLMIQRSLKYENPFLSRVLMGLYRKATSLMDASCRFFLAMGARPRGPWQHIEETMQDSHDYHDTIPPPPSRTDIQNTVHDEQSMTSRSA